VSGPRYLALRTWVSGPQREVSGPGSQDLGFRPSMRGFRTWISGPGFQALGIWLSGPGFQDLESSPSYGRLIFFLSLFSVSIVTFLFPVTFLCVHRHFSFCHHFSLHPVVTDRRTDGRSEFIYMGYHGLGSTSTLTKTNHFIFKKSIDF